MLLQDHVTVMCRSGYGLTQITDSSLLLAITNLQISPVFRQNISQCDINVQVSEGSSPQALSNGTCNAIVCKMPCPPELFSIGT